MSWIARLFRRDQLERDLDREMQFHLDAAIADHIRGGLSPDEARRRARMEFGGPEQMKEATRDARGTRWLEDFLQDCRLAFRGMRRSPTFAVAAILTIAIGVGANTGVWSIMDALMRRSLPIAHPEQLHAVIDATQDDEELLFSHPLTQRVQSELAGAGEVAGMASISRVYVAVADRPEPALAQVVTGNFFSFLGVPAQAGRTITPDDDRIPGGSPVIVISDAFWDRRFNRDPSAVGRTIRVNGFPVTIVGVLQRGFGGLTIGSPVDVYAPTMMQHQIGYRSNAASSNADPEKPWAPQNGISWLVPLARADVGTRDRIAQLIGRTHRNDFTAERPDRDSPEVANALRVRVGLRPIPLGFGPPQRISGSTSRTARRRRDRPAHHLRQPRRPVARPG